MVSAQLYPFESQYLSIGGHRYHYIESGSGDPVVMIHGNPSWSFYFRDLMQRLAPHYHCLAPDHIGMGYSDKPDEANYAYTFTQRAKDLEAFLELKQIRSRITLVLHDWGGPIGMLFARRHPERIHKMVLLNTAAFHLPAGKPLHWLLQLTRTALGGFAVRRFNAFCLGALFIGIRCRKLPPEVRQAYLGPYDSWQNRIGVLRFVQDIPITTGDPGYHEVTDLQDHLHLFAQTPVQLIWGMKDPIFNVHFLNKWLNYLPHAQVHRFPTCGHYILEDAPAEVGQLIEHFLTEAGLKR